MLSHCSDFQTVFQQVYTSAHSLHATLMFSKNVQKQPFRTHGVVRHDPVVFVSATAADIHPSRFVLIIFFLLPFISLFILLILPFILPVLLFIPFLNLFIFLFTLLFILLFVLPFTLLFSLLFIGISPNGSSQSATHTPLRFHESKTCRTEVLMKYLSAPENVQKKMVGIKKYLLNLSIKPIHRWRLTWETLLHQHPHHSPSHKPILDIFLQSYGPIRQILCTWSGRPMTYIPSSDPVPSQPVTTFIAHSQAGTVLLVNEALEKL